jgi:ribosomal protein S27AE
MKDWSEEQQKEVIRSLRAKGVDVACPRCNHSSFTLLDGYFNQPIQKELTGVVLGGPSVPSIIVICTNCGFMAQHALGPLGLMPKEERNDE